LSPRSLIVCILVFSGICSYGQTPRVSTPWSNLRQKWIPVTADTVQLDSLSIIPQTLFVQSVADSMYEVDWVNARMVWKHKPVFEKVAVKYRVFRTRFNAGLQHMVYDSVMNNFVGQPFVPNYGTAQNDRFFNFGNINYNGSFGRGISFGNSQDAVVTSNLNLQINGYLADSIEIAAAITDNNIPIQPDGTTQQLNEFDRIFLQFRKSNWQLSLGDIDIRQNQSYFLSFYKRLQGIAFETTTPVGSNVSNHVLLSGSIAKGKFTRNIFQGQEGNQGPYRLTGANNEFFFVVLANTERVFIDGELMQRGEDQDYVINYNTAEIAFTPRRMITKDSRIQVEFEYSDRNYLNSNLYGYNETTINDKLKIRLSAFSNADAKNSPMNQTLDPNQKHFLSLIGDSVQKAYYPNTVVDTFSAGKILYKKTDTVVNGIQYDSVYVFSVDPDSAFYSLSFIDAGDGNGDYIPDLNGANGKVYLWVAPVSGKKQGRYIPAVYLVTPKTQQVFSLGADYSIGSSTVITTELGMSNYDVNTFSAKDKQDDKGFAAKLGLKNSKRLSSRKGLTLNSDVGFEFVEARFKPLERLRNVEFTRDWGLPLAVQAADEKIITASVQLADSKANSLQYRVMNYQRSDGFNGIRHTIFHVQDLGGWKFNNVINYTNISMTQEKGYFFRPSLTLTRKFPALRNYSISANYSLEHNETRNRFTDSVSPQSFSFSLVQVGIKSDDAKPNHWGVTYFNRVDASPAGKQLLNIDRSNNINVFAELLKSEQRQLRLNATYRQLEILQSTLTTQKPDKSLLARAEYQFNEWKGFAMGNILYEVGAGQEQKRDYAFLQVPAGQGQYTWIDYDGNGIQSLNEFEIAAFQDQATFIRIFTPTNEFIKANYNTFNYSFSLNPGSVINSSTAKNLRKFVSKLSLQSSLQINKKEIAKGLVQFNPFSDPGDTSLITLNEILANTISFNRYSSKWGIDLNNAQTSNKALLTYGYETRRINEWKVKGRYNITRSVGLDISLSAGTNELGTSNVKFDNRNYSIDQRTVEPRITFTRGSNLRVVTGYRYSNKQNELGSQDKSTVNAINSEIKYNILQNSAILGRFTFSNISFTSNDSIPNANTTAAYIMLEGLMPGKNYLWNLELTKRLSNSLELNIQYEGRKPGTARVVHVGRASIRAIL
jgi:hypothetical protein